MVRVIGTHLVDVNISRKSRELLVHLINTSGSHGSEHTYIYNEITPLRDVCLEIDYPFLPKRVESVPAVPMEWEWNDGVVKLQMKQLDIYTIIVLEEENEE